MRVQTDKIAEGETQVQTDVVLYESSDRIATITINRPEKMNALNPAVAEALANAWRRFNDSDDRVAILTAAGEKAFSVGADLNDAPEIWSFAPGVGVPVDKPVIAAVNGWCVGGAVVLVQFCDLCVAGDGTRFSYPEAKIGFSGGLISSIAARMPHKLAMEFILVGEEMSAERAYQAGFVNKVVPPDQVMAAARDYAEKLAANAPLVTSMLKRHVADVLPRGPSEVAGMARRDIAMTFGSEDLKEGIAAFREKRKPEFRGS